MFEVYCKTLPSKYDTATASRHIDALTFNRIPQIGFDNLEPWVQETVALVCEHLAIFEYDYKDYLKSPVKSLSVNGVSVSYDFSDTSAFYKGSGVTIPRADYSLLLSTGLCSCIL